MQVINSKKSLKPVVKNNIRLLITNQLKPFDELYNTIKLEQKTKRREQEAYFQNLAHEFKNNINYKIK